MTKDWYYIFDMVAGFLVALKLKLLFKFLYMQYLKPYILILAVGDIQNKGWDFFGILTKKDDTFLGSLRISVLKIYNKQKKQCEWIYAMTNGRLNSKCAMSFKAIEIQCVIVDIFNENDVGIMWKIKPVQIKGWCGVWHYIGQHNACPWRNLPYAQYLYRQSLIHRWIKYAMTSTTTLIIVR